MHTVLGELEGVEQTQAFLKSGEDRVLALEGIPSEEQLKRRAVSTACD